MTSSRRAPGPLPDGDHDRPCVGDLRLPGHAEGITPEIMNAYRPRKDALVRRISDRICHEVAGFADPGLAGLVVSAIDASVDLFVDALAGAPSRGHTVVTLCRHIGRAEARAGHDLDAMRAAHHIASQEVWAELERVVPELGLPSATHQQLAHAIMDYQRRLQDEAVAAHAEVVGLVAEPRARLVAALLEGASPEHLARLATPCWPLPRSVAVAATEATARTVAAAEELTEALATTWRKRVVIVADASAILPMAEHLARRSPGPVAVSWGVAPSDTPHALRWARRTLRLVRQGTIAAPTSGVVLSDDHRFELWQQADPALDQHLVEATLGPLLDEKPSQRDVLSDTMLLWLQTHGSAPVMAERLGVHDQTVRHRLRRIRAMFGDALDHPDRAGELMQALVVMRRSLQR